MQIKMSFQKSFGWVAYRLGVLGRRPHAQEISFANKKHIFWKRFELILRESIYIIRHSRISPRSAQLTYTFILSIVPFIAILFTFIHSLHGFENIISEIFAPLIKRNFGTEIGNEIANYLQLLVQNIQVKELGIVSFITFSITVIFLLIQIEDTFDDIMLIHHKNNLYQRLLKCWIIITILPFFLVFASLKSTSVLSFIDLEHMYVFTGSVASWTRISIAMIFQTLCFVFAYYLLPSKRMQFKSVVVGGIVASLLFEALKYINVYLVKTSLSNDPSKIYGTVPLIAILFFVWLRFIWIVTLIGACVSLGCQKIFHQKVVTVKVDYPAKNLMTCVGIYCAISRKYKLAGSPLSVKTISKITGVSVADVQKWLDYLMAHHIVFKSMVDSAVTYFPSYHALMEESQPEVFLKHTLFSKSSFEIKDYDALLKYFRKLMDTKYK